MNKSQKLCILALLVLALSLIFSSCGVKASSNEYLNVDNDFVRDGTIRKDEEFKIYQRISAENNLDNIKGVLHIKSQDIAREVGSLVKGENRLVSWRVQELGHNYDYEYFVTWEYWINGNYHTFNSPYGLIEVEPYPNRSIYEKIALRIYYLKLFVNRLFSFPYGQFTYALIIGIMAFLVVVKLTP